MEQSPYYLSKHAFCCLAGNHYVFLDLRSDEYLCLGRKDTDVMKDLLDGHHLFDERSTGSRFCDIGGSDPSVVIQALLKKGLLVQNAAHGKPAASPRVNTPTASLMEGSDEPRHGIRSAHVWNFSAAAITASKNLRWDCIEHTVSTVQNRKSAYATAANAPDSGVITDLFEIFRTLRPYYPRPYLCLFDSLALLHFLARYGIFPQWVYGVKMEPFAAHCWVQAGDFVVNDIMDNVRDYTPIMSV